MPESFTRLILADDHAIVLHGLEQLFRQHPGFDVVSCCRSGEEALAAVRTLQPDVLVLDIRMPGLGGLEVLRTIASEHVACKVVLLTAAIADADAVEALQLGAMGLVLKESSPSVLIDCVRHVARGEQWIDRATMGRALGRALRSERATRDAAEILTPREIEIVRMIAQGHRNRAVAGRLSISEGTVKIHLHNVYQKLGVDGRLELAVWAQDKGLV